MKTCCRENCSLLCEVKELNKVAYCVLVFMIYCSLLCEVKEVNEVAYCVHVFYVVMLPLVVKEGT